MALKTRGSEDLDSESAVISEINITPLTDIFLVLLIIFMVTSSVISQVGVEVNLPSASQSTSQAEPQGVIVSLLPQGKMKVSDLEVAAGDYQGLEKALRLAFAHTASRLVILEGDRKVFLGSAIEVMDHARRAGASKFAIATSLEGVGQK